ncbi:amino acid adenylation domain-containing protein [Gordonia sp. SL306]|uniref:amino acid adenylation domain-containing protein n=1 Tax=Gordonia sp. SL306 TaxID=2995145 RepID=UPI002271DB36|nr:amino acid adenylation domain-containing protein [Gordonia sp. SL306]WAC53952.1 amino acid adenylation domain-containing protein [Gordonia sp. SL306]
MNRAQSALWYAQQALGDVPLAVAHYIELAGDVDVDTLCSAGSQAAVELGIASSRVITGAEGEPRLVIGAGSPDAVPRMSASSVADALRQMEEAAASPLPLDGPLTESMVIEADGRWFFYLRAHHLVIDGYGAAALLSRTAELYRRAVRAETDADGPAPQSPEVIVDYEQKYRSSSRHGQDGQYWFEELTKRPEPLWLNGSPADPVVSPVLSGIDIEASIAAGIEECARTHRTAVAAIWIAGICLYLSRARDRADIPLLIASSGRTTARLRAAAGCMSNLLPVAVQVNTGACVADWIGEVSAVLSEMLRHQQFRVEEMRRDRDPGMSSPLHDAPVINIAPVAQSLELGDAVTSRHRILTTGPVADVNIDLYATTPGAWRLDVEANPRRYENADAAAIADGVLACVQALSESAADAVVGDLQPWPARPEDPRPQAGLATIGDCVVSHAGGASTAVVDADVEYTYADIDAAARRIADVCRRHGVHPGDMVASVLPRSVAEVAVFWGVAYAGGCFVPIDPAHPVRRQQAMVDTVRPAIAFHAGPRPALGGVEQVDAAPLMSSSSNCVSDDRAAVTVDTPAYVIHTSGSTGQPRAVVVSHRGIGDLAAEIVRSYDLDENCVVAHVAAPGFDTAVVEILAAALAGASLAVVPDKIRGGTELAEFLNRHRVTHLLITPAALATLPIDDIETVTHLVVGGDVCPAPLIDLWAAEHVVRCAYGPTEATCSVAMTDPIEPFGTRRRIELGDPMSGVALLVLDSHLRAVPLMGEGELYIAGPSLALGYLRQLGVTSARFVAHPWGEPGSRMYCTGDRVIVRAEGRLEYVGRSDEQVKIRGFRVEPAEVDAAILRTGRVAACVTVARRRRDLTELHSYVVTREPARDLLVQLRSELSSELPTYLLPASITPIADIPVTANNKVDRARLPEPLFVSSARFAAPQSVQERQVVAAYERRLDVADEIGVDDDFFELGGNSLSATELVADLAPQYRVTVRDVFDGPTPRELAARLTLRTDDELRAPWTATTGRPVPLSPAQRNVPLPDGSSAGLIPFVLTVPGVIDAGVVRAMVRGTVERHQMLRSTFSGDRMFVDALARDDRWSVTEVEDTDSGFDWARAFLHRPMDLASEYPFRIGVGRGDACTHIAVAFHHIAVDGDSLRALATALRGGMCPAGYDYLDYVPIACREQARVRESELSFWRSTVQPGRLLVSGADRARPTVLDQDGRRFTRTVPESLWPRVLDYARHYRLPWLTVVRAALAVCLSARGGQDSVHIGGLVSGRDDRRWSGVVGMFVNTVTVVCPVSDTISGTIAAVRDAELHAYAHARTPFVEVAAELGGHVSNAHPLFQAMVTVDDLSLGDTAASPDSNAELFTGLDIGVTPLPTDVAKCDLHVSIVPVRGRQATIEILYATALYDEETAHAIVDELLVILHAVVAGPNTSD